MNTTLSSRPWERVRWQCFVRDGFRCRQCGRYGRLEADHIRQRKQGSALYDLDGIQTLCVACHKEKTRKENSRCSPTRDRYTQLVLNLLREG